MNKDLERYDLSEPAHRFTAPVLTRTQTSASLLLKAKQMIALREPDLEITDADLFTFSAVISNQKIDSYSTKMALNSLTNYAQDANEGVAFLDSHSSHNRIGYSLSGTLQEVGDPAPDYPRVTADFYTVRGLQLGALDTDNFIKGLQFGLIRDVSIGFKEGEGFQYTCSICGESLWSWDCMHIPGVEYEISDNPEEDPTDQGVRQEICFSWVQNARLSEVSAVYDGATPDAMIIKAAREQRAGRIKPDVLQMLERAYRIVLPATSKKFAGSDIRSDEDNMSEPIPSGTPDNKLLIAGTEVRGIVKGVGIAVAEDTGITDAVNKLADEVRRLKPMEAQAAEGKKLRGILIEDALKEGARAGGKSFDRDAKTKMLEGLDVDTIGELRATWKNIGDATFVGKKRVSADDPDAVGKEETVEGEDEEVDPKADPKPAQTVEDDDDDDASGIPDDAFGGV